MLGDDRHKSVSYHTCGLQIYIITEFSDPRDKYATPSVIPAVSGALVIMVLWPQDYQWDLAKDSGDRKALLLGSGNVSEFSVPTQFRCEPKTFL